MQAHLGFSRKIWCTHPLIYFSVLTVCVCCHHYHLYSDAIFLSRLDVEWRSNFRWGYCNPVATLQLCVGRICLIYQLIHTPYIPRSLVESLGNENYMFVGVEISGDVEKLLGDYDLTVSNTVDLACLAADRRGLRRNAGLKELAREVLGFEVEKPMQVTRSTWDDVCLSCEQIQYACVDAFVSFEIGRRLGASG
ncbi:hypothetical protein Nepgr_020498 [Nepenthes gracilis]|uniref:3'-5' exonuclease domain-containing protein n=1 Tax=Nepenthes gracilis TaxID=150966 RepID=A0AAD3XV44_NEPGR|nr:hypothetical protein Nepgr_020498 [Nepenthes gracilis]